MRENIVIAFLPDEKGIRHLHYAYIEKENKGSYRVRYQPTGDGHWYTENVKKRYAKLLPSQKEIEEINNAMEE